MEPLQELQCDGYLLSVDVRSVFGNLEEVCKVLNVNPHLKGTFYCSELTTTLLYQLEILTRGMQFNVTI